MQIKLGKSGTSDIFWNFGKGNNTNSHVLITGKSGTGKTSAVLNLVNQIATQVPVVIVDFSDSYTCDLISNCIKDATYNLIDVYKDGIALQLFECRKLSNGSFEKVEDAASRLSDILSNVFNFSMKQRSKLYQIIKKTFDSGRLKKILYNTENPFYADIKFINEIAVKDFKLLTYLLKEEKEIISDSICDKLGEFIDIVRMDCDAGISKILNGVTVFNLNYFSINIKKTLANLILWNLLEVQKSDKDAEIFIVVDEFQILEMHKDSPIFKILCEGRKYGIGLILSTQTIWGKFKNDVIPYLKQASLQLLFQQTAEDSKRISRTIDNTKQLQWSNVLVELEISTCTSIGQVSIGNQIITKSLIIKVPNVLD